MRWRWDIRRVLRDWKHQHAGDRFILRTTLIEVESWRKKAKDMGSFFM